jgi:hypothetical protein
MCTGCMAGMVTRCLLLSRQWYLALVVPQVQNVVLGPALVTAATFGLNIVSNFAFIAMFGFQVSCFRFPAVLFRAFGTKDG